MSKPIRLTKRIRIKNPRLLALGVVVTMVLIGTTTFLVIRNQREAVQLAQPDQGQEGAGESLAEGAGQSAQEVKTTAPESASSSSSAEASEAGETGLAQEEDDREEQTVSTAEAEPEPEEPKLPAEAPPVTQEAGAPKKKTSTVERVVLAVEASTGKGPATGSVETSESQGTPKDRTAAPVKEVPVREAVKPAPPPLSPQLAQMVNEQRNLRIARLREMLHNGKLSEPAGQ